MMINRILAGRPWFVPGLAEPTWSPYIRADLVQEVRTNPPKHTDWRFKVPRLLRVVWL